MRAKKKNNPNITNNLGLTLRTIEPLTENQKRVFDFYDQGYNLFLSGCAGTGKSFIALYLALRDLFYAQTYKKVTIIRNTVSARDIGFLPGTLSEKIGCYEDVYHLIVSKLFLRDDAFNILFKNRLIDFKVTSFLRGYTFEDEAVVVDEVENMNFHELDTIITRIGNNCRLIFLGDLEQTDLKSASGSGMIDFFNILYKMKSFAFCDFTVDDIVRSGLVKEYLLAKHNKIYYEQKED